MEPASHLASRYGPAPMGLRATGVVMIWNYIMKRKALS